MKYSLRSLMRFSIRDLLWLFVVVALTVKLWIGEQERDNQKRLWEEHLIQLGIDRANDKVEIKRLEMGLPKGLLPVFVAPAPNPPKP
jgi:hypothetical protein